MAGKVSPIVKKSFLEELFGLTNTLQLNNVYLAFGLASGTPAVGSDGYYGDFIEPSDISYSRECVGDYSQSALKYFGQSASTLTTDANGKVTIKNSKEIKFDTYRGASNLSVKYVMLMNAATGGKCLMYFEIDTALALQPNELLVVPAGSASAYLD